jgi:hypothetical protein
MGKTKHIQIKKKNKSIKKKKHYKNIYCGNNKYSSELVNKSATLGSNYECFKKGIGIGLNNDILPIQYEAIDKRKIYCGNKQYLPKGYDYYGNLPMCLQMGVGVGISKK